MTSEIFDFLFQFASVLGNWCAQLWDFLEYEIDLGEGAVPIWALLSVGGVAILVLLKIIRKALL